MGELTVSADRVRAVVHIVHQSGRCASQPPSSVAVVALVVMVPQASDRNVSTPATASSGTPRVVDHGICMEKECSVGVHRCRAARPDGRPDGQDPSSHRKQSECPRRYGPVTWSNGGSPVWVIKYVRSPAG